MSCRHLLGLTHIIPFTDYSPVLVNYDGAYRTLTFFRRLFCEFDTESHIFFISSHSNTSGR